MSTGETVKTSAADLAGHLRREISRGSYANKDRLPPERILAERFGTARGTVRSAIRQLEEDGFVETKAGSGTYVIAKSTNAASDVVANASPLELIDARFALEPHMCRLSVLNAKEHDFARMEELLDQMEALVHDPVKFAELDTRLHSLIAETTGNDLLIWIVTQINSVRNQEQWSLMRHLTLNEKTITTYNVHHRQIVNAIRAREPERAAQLMKDHLEAARLSLTRAAST